LCQKQNTSSPTPIQYQKSLAGNNNSNSVPKLPHTINNVINARSPLTMDNNRKTIDDLDSDDKSNEGSNTQYDIGSETSKSDKSRVHGVAGHDKKSTNILMKKMMKGMKNIRTMLKKIGAKDESPINNKKCDIVRLQKLNKEDKQKVYKKIVDSIFPKIKYWPSTDREKHYPKYFI